MASIISNIISKDILKKFNIPDFYASEIEHNETKGFTQTDSFLITEKIEGIDCLLCYSSDKSGELDDYCIYVNNALAATSKKILIKEHKEILKEICKVAEDTINSTSGGISYKSFHQLFSFSPVKSDFEPNSLLIFLGTIYGKDCPGCERYSVTGQSSGFKAYAAAILNKTEINAEKAKGEITLLNHLVDINTLSLLSQKLCIPLNPARDSLYGKIMPDSQESLKTFLKSYTKSYSGLEYNSNGNSQGIYIFNNQSKKLYKVNFSNHIDIPPTNVKTKNKNNFHTKTEL